MPTKKEKLCYFCGMPGAVTRDHIPPRSIFPHKPTGTLITVPAHKHCNKSFEKDDSLFRDLIVITSSSSPHARKAWKEQVVTSWLKDPGAKARLRSLVTEKTYIDPISNVARVLPAVNISVELVNRQIHRWTRGLYYKRFGKPLDQDALIEVDVYDDSHPVVTAFTKMYLLENKMPKWVNIEPGVFRYFYPVSTENDNQGAVVFEFFGRQAYVASINL